MDDRPRNLRSMLVEAKDSSELMVDLAYAALYFGDPDLAEEVDAEWVYDSATATAYIECAQACGLSLLGGPPTAQTAVAAHSRGVGRRRTG